MANQILEGGRQIFKLKGLSERSEYNGKTFAELLSRDQRRLRNTSLRAIHIKQLKPSRRSDSVFHIFERLNTGGTRLKPQEIRNAVYRGKIVDDLRVLNDNTSWRKILDIKYPDKNQKDVEIILRLFSLFEIWNGYEKPMLRYLNNQMHAHRSFRVRVPLNSRINSLRSLSLCRDWSHRRVIDQRRRRGRSGDGLNRCSNAVRSAQEALSPRRQEIQLLPVCERGGPPIALNPEACSSKDPPVVFWVERARWCISV